MHISQFESKQMKHSEAMRKHAIPLFGAGDKIVVHVRIREGERERVQKYEGVCIFRRNAALRSSFIVRRISNGYGIERKFFIYSPLIERIECLHYGLVRRAKPYYLRNLSAKASRLVEDKRRSKRALAHKNDAINQVVDDASRP